LDLIESLQFQAMGAVMHPDDDAWARKIFRYYSKQFSTPLHLVYEMPFEDVIREVLEDMFDSMSEEDREEKIEWLLMTPKERAEHDASEGNLGKKDDEFLDRVNAEVSAGESIKRPEEKTLEPSKAGMQALTKRIQRAREKALKASGSDIPKPKTATKPASKEPETIGELPEFKMEFGPSPNLTGKSWADSLDPLGPPPKKKT
jgi:hypothetical protein